MMVTLILDPQTGDYFQSDDESYELPITLKTLSLGKFIAQKKKKGVITYSYEFPDGFTFPKKRGRKKVRTTNIVPEDDEDSEERDEEVPEEEVTPKAKKGRKGGRAKKQAVPEPQVRESSGIPREGAFTKQAHKTPMKTKHKIKFVEDKTVAPNESKIVLARAKMKTTTLTKPQTVIKECSVCHRKEELPAWEGTFYTGMLHRCTRCMGG